MARSAWEDKLHKFCQRYDLEIEYLADILNDPKVIPMIRGKSFEFTAQKLISEILPKEKYQVFNPRLNAQTGLQDVDIAIINLETGKQYSTECKLAAKGSFRLNKRNKHPYLRVKCMRSRTLGEEAAFQRAKTTGISKDLLMIHNDQYMPGEFDFVVTSIANAFYETDEEGLFHWSPPQNSQSFLSKLDIETQQDAFRKIYIAKSELLAANQVNQVKCTRQKCKIENCNFIPNYPYIYFDLNTGKPLPPWIPLEEFETLLD